MRNLTKIFSSILVFSLLLGMSLLPLRVAQAGFLSSLFPDQAYADADTSANIITPPQTGDNSQSMNNALQVSDSSQVSNSKNNDSSSAATVIDDSGTAIVAPTGPMGVSDGKDTSDSSNNDTSVYVVRDGDSLSQIAAMFGVSVDTILWANDMKKGDTLTPGDVLLILPVSGLEHTVTKGQTLQIIAKLY
ncbi:MAG: LysM domain-containing protein, partial [Minisyncoccia bacterium]